MGNMKKNKRTYIIIGLCAIITIMAVGFAAFSQQLRINPTSEVTGSWCLGFDNTKTNTYVTATGIQNGTTPTGSMTYNGSTCGTKSQTGVTLASSFKQPGDSIEYTLTILNEGSLDAAIKSITLDNETITSDQTVTKGNVKYKVEMPETTSIAANNSTTMRVIVSFQNDTDINHSYSGEQSSVLVKVNAEQDDGNGGLTPSFTGTIYSMHENYVNIGDSIDYVLNVTWQRCNNPKMGPITCSDTEYATLEECTNGAGLEDICNEVIEESGIETYTQDPATLDSTSYLKHTVVNNVVTESYICFVTDTEHCMRGGVDECQWDDDANNGSGACTYNGTPTIFNTNTQLITDLKTFYNVDNNNCEFNDLYSYCSDLINSNIYFDANSSGIIHTDKCDITEQGSRCEGILSSVIDDPSQPTDY